MNYQELTNKVLFITKMVYFRSSLENFIWRKKRKESFLSAFTTVRAAKWQRPS
jgi:hypothetical protein